MKTKNYCPVLVTALCAFVLPAQAGWGSVRANNRSERRHEPVADRRRLDIEGERRHAFYWAGYHPGSPINVLPAGSVEVSVNGIGFYYYDGVFFSPTTTGFYAAATPPVGIVVPKLAEGAEPIVVGATTCYYSAGAFYVQQPNGFVVVPAPLGVTVTGLPPGASPTVINGVLYYVSDPNYFQPVMQGGVTVYVTAHP